MSSSVDDSDVDSFATLQETFEQLSEVVDALHDEIHALENRLTLLHKPLSNLHLDAMTDILFLASSPFRFQTFAIQPPGFPGVDLTKRYKFHEICEVLRTYIIDSGLADTNGNIVVNKTLKQLFGIQESHTTFLECMAHLRNILV